MRTSYGRANYREEAHGYQLNATAACGSINARDGNRDAPLPIGEEQTISQPFAVAHMIEALALKLEDRVLDVGTGSGYAAVVMSHIAKEVHSIERHERLARTAAERLQQFGYDNVEFGMGTARSAGPTERLSTPLL